MILELNIFNLIFLILIIPISLLFEGIRRKLTAKMQNRIGPPVWQPFYDVMKLVKKKDSDTKAKDNLLFQIIPVLYFITTFVLFLFVPFSIVSFQYDFILFVYIVILSGALYILAGSVSNSPFSSLGSLRETLLMVCYEIIFVIAIFTFMVYTNESSLVEFQQRLIILKLPLVSFSLFFVALVEMRITPMDTVEAYTEISGSVETEYSGKELALLEISKCMKFTFFILLTTSLFFGFQNLILFSATTLAMLFIYTFLQATTCRYRLDQVFNLLIFLLFLSVIDLIRIHYFMW